MATSKKIEINDTPEEERLDIALEDSEQAQSEWSDSLEEEAEQSVEQQSPEDVTSTNETETIQQDEQDANEPAAEMSGEVQASPEQPSEGETANEKEANPVDAAVDEIVEEESDKLLEHEDEALERQFAPPSTKKSVMARLRSLPKAWWQHKRWRYGTLIGVPLLLIVGMFVPMTRYGMLNLAGVRVQSSMIIVDSVSGRPLKNIPVQLQGSEVRSDDDGKVSFSNLRLGASILKVDKRGYAPFEKSITLGWGSNPIGEQGIVATGAQYTFIVKDWMSGLPIADAEAVAGEDVGQADDEGVITLTIGSEDEDIEVVLSAENYRDETRVLSEINEEETIVEMVPGRKHAFVSNRSGMYDLYAIDVDGKNEELLLKATGKEREIPFVLPHPKNDIIAFISSRDGDLNKDKFILDGLFTVDTVSGETYKITRSEQVQIIGWAGDKLVYVAVVEGASAANSQRSKLVSFDLETKQRTDLAAANYFNDVKLIGETVYYATSSYAVPQNQAKLFSIKVNGKDKETVVDTQVWSIIRRDYETLLFNATDLKWYEKVGSAPAKKLDVEPAQKSARTYSVSPDGKKAAWVDVRDGKGVLLLYDVSSKEEKVFLTRAGLADPVLWLDDRHLVFRSETTSETADYVVNIDGGEARKIADVIGNRSRYFF